MNRRKFVSYSALAGLGLSSGATAKEIKSPWSIAAPLPIKTQELYPAVHKGKLYVAGGIASRLGVIYFTDRFFSYDPNKDQWEEETNLPEDLHHAALVSTGNRLFLVGGFNGGFTHVWRMRNAVYEYVDKTWVLQPSLPAPQAEGVLTALEGNVHLVTGQSPKGEANSKRSDHREVDTHLVLLAGDEKWTSAAPIPLACNSATGGWISDSLIVTGGRNANGNFSNTHIYDPKEDRWRSASPLPLPQAGTASVVVDNGLIVFGGEIFVPQEGVFENVWHYSLAEDEWQALPNLKTPRHGLGAGKIGDRIFVVGGATEPSGKGTSDLNEVLTL